MVKYIDKLRNSGLRPTKQRLQICEVLFDTEKTFHFTINELDQKIKKQKNNKISLATIYNTVHAFEKKGYLKQIPINSNQTYFDTNDPITVGVKRSKFNKKGFWNDMIVGSQEFATAIIYPTKSR